jgi:hypothetical protein
VQKLNARRQTIAPLQLGEELLRIHCRAEDLNAIGEFLVELPAPKAKEEKEIVSRSKLTLFQSINR